MFCVTHERDECDICRKNPNAAWVDDKGHTTLTRLAEKRGLFDE